MARKSTGKKLRFEIFKRDGFRCVYCGATPVQKVLRIDHVVPVADGGDNSADNLVTACHDCNSGKGAVPLDRSALTGGPSLSPEAMREHAEQIREYLSAQKELDAARKAVADVLIDHWQTVAGPMSQDFANRIPGLLRDWPLDRLRDAADIMAHKLGAPGARFVPHVADAQVRYFYGILRRWRENEGA